MDFKGHIIDQKGFIKRYKKGQHVEFLDLIYLFLAEFSLAKLGGPLSGNNLLSSF